MRAITTTGQVPPGFVVSVGTLEITDNERSTSTLLLLILAICLILRRVTIVLRELPTTPDLVEAEILSSPSKLSSYASPSSSSSPSCTPCAGPPQQDGVDCGRDHRRLDRGTCGMTTHWDCALCATDSSYFLRLTPNGQRATTHGPAPPLLPRAAALWPVLAGLNDTVARFGPDDMFGRLIGPTIVPLYQLFDEASGAYRLHWDDAATRAGGDFTLQLVHLRGG